MIAVSMFDALDDPQLRHAAMVHMPVALGMLAVIATLLSAALAWKFSSFRWMALTVIVLLGVSAQVAVNSGEGAEEAIPGTLDAEVSELLNEHEGKAQKVWLFAVAAGVFTLASAVPKPAVRHGAAWLAFLTAAAGAFWVADTAHHGGTLIYAHGVGVELPVIEPEPEPEVSEDPDEPQDGATEVVADARVVFFRETVRPILEENCFKCHNDVRTKGGLDQTSIATLLVGGDTGAAVVPGHPDRSMMIQRIAAEDENDVMPPDERLPEEQIAAIRQWIEAGAAWE